ncbi:hypothetical protein JOL62DRAFT_554513 [Phyllosticta paracitricarpa]|uniref:DUF7918 domain-containing protein n=2 Tax=Phyllosticta TaxID=121621 RepID=A0ABR1LIC6_9PEZI
MNELQIMDNMDVHIRVKGQRLEEYVDEGAEKLPRTIIKYVVVEPGEDFAIAYNFDRNFLYKCFDLGVKVYLDGKRVTSAILAKNTYVGDSADVVDSTRHGEDEGHLFQGFTFAELIINEEDEELDADQQMSVDALGEIQLKFWRVEVTSEFYTFESSDCKNVDEISEVPEKALKGRSISHHAKLSTATAQPRGPHKVANVTDIDPKDRPFATYIIRYRSTEALKIMGLIPRTPEPIPLEERPVDELTPEEMKELIRRQKVELETARDIKRESSSEPVQPKWEQWFRSQWEDGDELSVTEVRPAKRTKTSEAPIDTVDLTDD